MTDVMILAAGLGTRMKSKRAKVLHELAGLPLVAHVLRAAFELAPEAVFTVVGHQAADVEAAVRNEAARGEQAGKSRLAREQDAGNEAARGEQAGMPALPGVLPGALPELLFVLQADQRGTGHAVIAAREQLAKRQGDLVVLAGDAPLIKGETLKKLVDTHQAEKNDVTMLTVLMDDPTGYGRIIRDEEGRLVGVVEQKDGSAEELAVKEVCVSIYCFNIAALIAALDHLTTDNAQGEYYLTDVPKIMQAHGKKVGLLLHSNADEVMGVNTRIELADLERKLRERKLRELMLSGVTIVDPATTYINQDVEVGQDTVIHPQVIIEGASTIGSACIIQSWTRMKNVQIGDNVTIRNSSVIEDSVIKDGATVGPFSRLRAGAEIGEKAAIGNFVEVKKSKIGRGTKASHLTYLGDATLGERVNIGAGTVTCNYDGVNKNETIIEDDVKIGSDTMLVAPVRVGHGSVTGAGSVVTEDVPPDSLAVGVPAKVKKKLG
ncbi:MAG TPA: bifunctional UDP-N-acetylglucosamine diphosphorylase/glucosamine-1-phosphate N-acetyltransferase GlmU [Blastocatellia bacterium]|nr:bifunctional UDP-N-acetylglucosamine diphosphorylase/glucosamine-1-phosphate N-acetyltransferase GlmU [Blastocatellia bacterium]